MFTFFGRMMQGKPAKPAPTGHATDDLLIDDNGDHLFIDDSNNDVRKIND